MNDSVASHCKISKFFLFLVVGGDVPTAKERLLLTPVRTVENLEIWRQIRIKLRFSLWITLWITCAYPVYNQLTLSLSSSSVAAFTSNQEESMERLSLLSPSLRDITLAKENWNNENNMLKLERLMLAIAAQEGWSNSIENPNRIGSRSWRNKNPGNLRSSPLAAGTRDRFAVFDTDALGWEALRWDISQKARGNTVTGLNGKSTLSQLIHVWAPPSDNNDSLAYIRNIVKMTGIPADTTLDEIVK